VHVGRSRSSDRVRQLELIEVRMPRQDHSDDALMGSRSESQATDSVALRLKWNCGLCMISLFFAIPTFHLVIHNLRCNLCPSQSFHSHVPGTPPNGKNFQMPYGLCHPHATNPCLYGDPISPLSTGRGTALEVARRASDCELIHVPLERVKDVYRRD
jgi:hypothetical protein